RLITSAIFFQAEDGIRDYKVTGVQTCALPIYPTGGLAASDGRIGPPRSLVPTKPEPDVSPTPAGLRFLDHTYPGIEENLALDERSEERRVGKECRTWGLPYSLKKKKLNIHIAY